ncbi:hypothetical protein DPMN_068839 [Dreissena polymorpha]|nr:hypothetical protein DPMN_068839 [Dreissena polymorpha]
MDTIDSATVASAREFSTHLRELQSISNKVKKDLTGIKTQKEVEDFTLQCNGKQQTTSKQYTCLAV